jgi:hypothetical protein
MSMRYSPYLTIFSEGKHSKKYIIMNLLGMIYMHLGRTTVTASVVMSGVSVMIG